MSGPAQRLLVNHPDLAPPLTQTLYQVQRGACFHCGDPMASHPWTMKVSNGWTREHVIPSCTGATSYLNVVLAHQRCNNLRSDKPLPLAEIGRARLIILAAAIWRKRRGLNDGVGYGVGSQRYCPL